MADDKNRIGLPEDMRGMVEAGLSQAREGVSRIISAAHAAAESLEQKVDAQKDRVQEVQKKNQMFAESSVAAAFALAENLLKARSVDEVVRLQKEYAANQFSAFKEHFSEAGEDLQRQTRDATEDLVEEVAKFRDSAKKTFEEGLAALKNAAPKKD